MSTSQILTLLGGVALFLFGMTLMGDGLKKVSGSALEPILYRLSGTPLRGILLGTGVTAVLQSSCATSVMAVSFVNSGMMKVRQAVGVILGSILGTSVTGWIVCLGYIEGAAGWGDLLSAKTITGVAALIGIILRLFCKRPSWQHIGDILMGFAILMLGMTTMSGAVEPLGEQPWFIAALTSMTNPLLGILAGAAFAAILQSASAAAGILQALSVTGAVSFDTALPLLLGISVGASLPVLLAAVGSGTDGRRAAVIYPAATLPGTALFAALFYAANAVFRFPFSLLVMSPVSIAAVNTLMRLTMLCLLTPMIGILEKASRAVIREKPAPDRSAA